MAGRVLALVFLQILLFGVPTVKADPVTITEPGGNRFSASHLDFSYVILTNQTALTPVGTFTQQGGGFFGSYRNPTLADVVSNTGINKDYKLYALFSGTGTVNAVSGGQTSTYDSFNLRLFLDPGSNSTLNVSPTGSVGGTVTAGGITSDDILVGQSNGLVAGAGHAFPGLANGDFHVQFTIQPVGGFLSGPLPFTIGDFNGVHTSLQGFSAGAFQSGRIDGSGNLSVVMTATPPPTQPPSAVPEPGTLLMLGSGIALFGAWRSIRG